MKPDPTPNSAAREPDQRRRLRLFAAFHLGAVGAIYALAWLVGGGLASPPMPPLNVAPVASPAERPAPLREGAAAPVLATDASVLPAWAQRAEITPPWESR